MNVNELGKQNMNFQILTSVTGESHNSADVS